MRMRKKRHGAERIAACSEYFITNQSEYNSFPAELEIGCGKGAFILGCAKRYPDRNFVAMEKISDVILLAAEKLGLKPQECIALEDSQNGIKSASSAGCKTVMVPDLDGPSEEIKPLLYDVADGLKDVVNIIRNA